MKDFHQQQNAVNAIGCAVLTASNTPTGIDLAGYQGAEIVLCIGVGGVAFTAVNKIEFVLTHSHDDVTYVNVVDSDVLGALPITTGIIKSLTATHAAAAVYRFGYVGPRRYLKLTATFSGTHTTGTAIAAVVMRSYPGHAPLADQN